jgi:prophage regulatory protein
MNAPPATNSTARQADAAESTAAVRLLPISEVMQQCGLRSTTIYERIRLGTFPAPVKSGASARWVSTELDEWIARLIAARDAAPPRIAEGAAA